MYQLLSVFFIHSLCKISVIFILEMKKLRHRKVIPWFLSSSCPPISCQCFCWLNPARSHLSGLFGKCSIQSSMTLKYILNQGKGKEWIPGPELTHTYYATGTGACCIFFLVFPRFYMKFYLVIMCITNVKYLLDECDSKIYKINILIGKEISSLLT